MRTIRLLGGISAVVGAAAVFFGAGPGDSASERLAAHRNLGKAFYENPTTQLQAAEEFRKALELAPKSARERLNYGLALLRAGKTTEGITEIERVQKQDPKLPHTWFNLGIQWKKLGESEKALAQFEQMVRMVPDEPVSRYNFGVLLKLEGKLDRAIAEFEAAARLDARLAAPHFQLFNAYRVAGKAAEAQRELQTFQRIKKEQEGAVIAEDMEWSFYAEILDAAETLPAEAARLPDVRFENRTLAGKADAKTAGIAALDARDLIVWSASGVLLYRKGELVGASGLESLKDVVFVAPGDFNNDGATDLCVVTAAGPMLFKNEGGKFVKQGFDLPRARFDSAVWIDYDHDYDVDLLLLGPKPRLFRNAGAAGFQDKTASFPFQAGHALEAVSFRLIADSKGMDLAMSYRDHAGVLYRDLLGGAYKAEALAALPAGARDLDTLDADNDGEMDIAYSGSGVIRNGRGKLETLAGPMAGRGGVFADLENRGVADRVGGAAVSRGDRGGKFGAAVARPGLVAGVAWAAGDFEGDGRVDLACVGEDGSVHIFVNRTVARNSWLRVKLTGVKNLKLAPGAEVEVKAGQLYQKKMYMGAPLLFGLRDRRVADTVRITWPNGLIQNETQQAAGKSYDYKEAQRLSGSCPMIWTWNGREFQFVTDVLGVAPLGASAGDGAYFPVDHDEHIEIPAGALVARDGMYEVRVTEELSEVAYLDQVRLIAVDHAVGSEVFVSDKFKAPPFPEFRLYGAARRVYPVAARDTAGRDVLERVTRRDRRYVDSFKRDLSGVAERSVLTLDFGKAAAGNRAVLLLNGWVDWADGSTFLQAAQESKDGLVFPYLQVRDAAGQWKTVVEDMGIPAGKPKTIAVDLTGKFLSASREVRIVTNLCVYWDEVFLSEDSGAPAAVLSSVAPLSAALRFRGFSRAVIHPERLQPESFVYGEARPASNWNPTPGMYTRYGAVEALLGEVDDRFVIMGSGDEARLLFDAGRFPPVAAGMRRTFVLKVDGWAKDRDANTAYSQSVEPLPFHGMSQYPYPAGEAFPVDSGHRAWAAEYNTRPALRLLRPMSRAR